MINNTLLKMSVITTVYNNKDTIEESINSVLSQSYGHIEYIIIDAGSTDGTMEIINRYKDRIAVLVSKPDNGIYEGLNAGIALATGDVVGFLHSDDLYEDNHVVEDVMDVFHKYKVDSVYGDLVYVDKSDTQQIIRYWKSGLFTHNRLPKGWMPPHPTFFVKRSIYEQYGSFDTSFKIAADYDLILRFLGKFNISTHYLPQVLIRMRNGGTSNRSLKNLFLKSKEDLQAIKDNDIGNLFSLLRKNLSKIQQFIFPGDRRSNERRSIERGTIDRRRNNYQQADD